jgi:hypothetical protein
MEYLCPKLLLLETSHRFESTVPHTAGSDFQISHEVRFKGEALPFNTGAQSSWKLGLGVQTSSPSLPINAALIS